MTTNLMNYEKPLFGSEFRSNSRQVVRELGFFRSCYAGTEVTSPQAHILLELELEDCLDLNVLIEKVQMDKSSASRTITRMLKKGWIQRSAKASDGRRKPFCLTALGRQKLKHVNQYSVATIEKAFQNLTQNERSQVENGMQLYAKALTKARIQNTFEIRTIKPADDTSLSKVIRKILKEEFQETHQEVSQMLPELASLSKYYKQAKSVYIVVLVNGKVRGGAGISKLKSADDQTCELQKMYLAKEVRGKGIGSLLLNKCLEFAKAQGYQKCYLDTRETMVTARALYEKYGFRSLSKPLGLTGHCICDRYYLLEL